MIRSGHGVVYQTARTDLLEMAAAGLPEARKVSNRWHFSPVPDLERRLRDSAGGPA